MLRKIRLYLAVIAATIAAMAATSALQANAAVLPVINIMQGSVPGGQVSASGVSGYYGADDAHTHYKYVQTEVVATTSLVNLNGAATTAVGASGAELCDENTGNAAQIGLYSTGPGVYGVAWDSATLPGWGLYDDACIEGGLLAPIPSLPTSHKLLTGTVIHTGDVLLLGISYNPSGHFGFHQLQFFVTDLTQVNEHRSATIPVFAKSFTEYGIGVLSNAGMITAPANNLIGGFSADKVNFYSSTKPAYPITQGKAFYGYGGLSEVNYINGSSQVLISPDNSLIGGPTTASFSVFEGSTTP